MNATGLKTGTRIRAHQIAIQYELIILPRERTVNDRVPPSLRPGLQRNGPVADPNRNGMAGGGPDFKTGSFRGAGGRRHRLHHGDQRSSSKKGILAILPLPSIPIPPLMILDTLGHSARYESLHPRFAKAFAFLRAMTGSEAPGRHEIEGDDLFALIQQVTTKPLNEALFEAHRQYIDVQYVQHGRKTILWAPLESMRRKLALTIQAATSPSGI